MPQPPTPCSAPAPVVHLNQHRPAAAAAGQGGGPVAAHSDPGRDGQAVRQVVEIVQALYLARGHSLADPVTAEVHGIALDAAGLLLDAVLAAGELTEEGHASVRNLLDAAREVPDLL